MHIADGVLTPEITAVITVVSAIAFYKAIKTIKEEEIPLTAVASAMFFIASFIHVPFGVTQIHLILLGVIGIFLGFSSFIAILIALILQALLLGYGGVVSIGVNLFIMAAPAVIVYYINKNELFLKINENKDITVQPLKNEIPSLTSSIKFFNFTGNGILYATVNIILKTTKPIIIFTMSLHCTSLR